MTADAIRCDVCVVGAGPAGVAAALRLADLGRDVCLVAPSPLGKNRRWESLTPGALKILNALGLGTALANAHCQPSHVAAVTWGGDVNRASHAETTFLVDRTCFDACLMDAARRRGVRLLTPAVASRPQNIGSAWLLPITTNQTIASIHAAHIIDATGRKALSGGRRRRLSPATLALCARWRGRPHVRNATRIEATAGSWLWSASLVEGIHYAAVFVDPRSLRVAGDTPAATFLAAVNGSSLRWDGALGSTVTACDASAIGIARAPGMDGIIAAGEAAFSLDPLSSQGIQRALVDGQQSAIVVNTLIVHPERRDVALAFHAERQAEAAYRDRLMCQSLYREQAISNPSPFWSRYCGPGALLKHLPREPLAIDSLRPETRLRLSPQARLEDVAVIDGDVIALAPALFHPDLDRPIAFLAGRSIRSLLARVISGVTAGSLFADWSADSLPEGAALKLLQWFWQRRLLVDNDCTPLVETASKDGSASVR
ncbi:tryptophan 7-halogenase [Mesorhizobium sp. M0166]|uniref:flavin-dependent monooxygenase QhpG n=1 Tax=unclassified Mesorhizobium TaxID=325217 RepID=UPI00333A82EA